MWLLMVVKVTEDYMVTCGSARLQWLPEVTWFHVVTHGFTGYTWFYRLHMVTHGFASYMRLHGFTRFHMDLKASQGYIVTCGFTWL